ncbi:hypothetical protein [Actinocorallia populi]|nr:hypothetical protein [Actinocorallia populi]
MNEVPVTAMGAVGFVLLMVMVLSLAATLAFLALSGRKGRHR